MKMIKKQGEYGLIDLRGWSSTVMQSRLSFFQPTRRPTDKSRTIETAHGRTVVSGRLGQAHADALEACSSNPIDKLIDPAGRLVLLLDPADLARTTGIRTNILENLLLDAKKATLDFHFMRGGTETKVACSILDKFRRTESVLPNHAGAKVGGERKKWVIVFSQEWTCFMQNDIKTFWPVKDVAKLKSGVSQAVARLVLTHQQQPAGGWKIDTLLAAIGVDVGDSIGVRHRRRELRKDSPALETLGILVADDRVSLKL